MLLIRRQNLIAQLNNIKKCLFYNINTTVSSLYLNERV